MLDKKRFGLNRITAPGLGLAEFYALAAKLGIKKVELRNDIRDGQIIDGLRPKDAADLAIKHGVQVITINALQKFNLAVQRPKAKEELARLLTLCGEIGCPAIVLCPNNDSGDLRSPELRFSETVDSLREFAPMFEKAGVLGYVEPLGFGISSLASVDVAVKAIRQSGSSRYRIVVDTFHHYLGPDSIEAAQKAAEAGLVGLVHISSVEADIPASEFRDAHRLLPSAKDVMGSKAIMQAINGAGYKGDISFEPFSVQVQKMAPALVEKALKDSMSYLSE
jgi:2-keto-myo-inositol isomerase